MLLKLKEMSLSVGTHQLLDSASAHVCAWQRIALVGRNGRGKSTLIRAIVVGLGCCSGLGEDAVPYFPLGAGSIGDEVTMALLVGQDNSCLEALLGSQTLSEEKLREMTLEDVLDVAACYGEGAVEEGDAWRDLSLQAISALGWLVARYGTMATLGIGIYAIRVIRAGGAAMQGRGRTGPPPPPPPPPRAPPSASSFPTPSAKPRQTPRKCTRSPNRRPRPARTFFIPAPPRGNP